MNPKISVIIPVYNVERYLEQCLQSVCQPGNIEILCIEDCSTDSSLDILKKWENIDKRITVIQHTENRGLSAARNTGILNAQGDYVMFVDSDDMLKTGAYVTVLQYMQKDRLDALRFNAEMIFDETMQGKPSNIAPQWWVTPEIYAPAISGREMFINQKLNGHYRQPTQIYAIRRQFLLDNNLMFQEGIYHEDELFTLTMILKCKRISAIKDKIYVYRYRENSITTMEKSRKHFDSIVFIIDTICKTLYTDEPERLKRTILMHLCFLFFMLQKCYQKLPEDSVFNNYEREMIEIGASQPDWMFRNMIERFIHKWHE